MRQYRYGVVVASILMVGCDLQKLPSDIASAVNALQQDKTIVEGLAADIKRSYTPDSKEYQSAEASYFMARRACDRYLAGASLAAATGDRSVVPDASIEEVRGLMTAFARNATTSLSPADRSLPELISFAAFPTVQKLISMLPARRRAEGVRAVIGQVQWRSWDSISTEFAADETKEKPKSRLRRN